MQFRSCIGKFPPDLPKSLPYKFKICLINPLNSLWKLLAINPLLYISYWFYLSCCTMTATPTILTQLLWESGPWVQCHKRQQSISVLILIVLLVLFVIVNLIFDTIYSFSLCRLLHLLAQINNAFIFFLILAILTRMEWHLVMVLIVFSKCKWFLTSFNFFTICIYLWKYIFMYFPCFITTFFFVFCFWVLRLPDVFWTLVLFQLCCLQIFFPNLNGYWILSSAFD